MRLSGVMQTSETIQEFCRVYTGFTGSRTFVYLQKWSLGFCFGPFLKLRFQFPFWKAFSNYGFDGHKDVYEYFRGKLLAMVRTLAKTPCASPSCVCF